MGRYGFSVDVSWSVTEDGVKIQAMCSRPWMSSLIEWLVGLHAFGGGIDVNP